MCGDPMHKSLGLSLALVSAAQELGDNLLEVAIGGQLHLLHLHHSGVLQPDDLPGRKPKELRMILLPHIALLHIVDPAQTDPGKLLAVLLLREKGLLALNPLVLPHVLEDELDRLDDAKRPLGDIVQVLAHAVLQELKADHHLIAPSGHTHRIAEIVDGFPGVPPPPHSINRQEPRIIPSVHVPFHHQHHQFPLRQHCPTDIQSGKLILVGAVDPNVLEHPVIQIPSDFELQSAQRIINVLQRIADAMGEVIARVNAPFVARVRMRRVSDSVAHWVAHCWVRMRRVDLQFQTALRLGVQSHPHSLKLSKTFANWPVPKRRRTLQPSVFLHFGLALLADIRFILFDQLNCKLIQLIKIIGSMRHFPRFVPQPLNIVLNTVYKLVIFFLRVCIYY